MIARKNQDCAHLIQEGYNKVQSNRKISKSSHFLSCDLCSSVISIGIVFKVDHSHMVPFLSLFP